LRLYTIQSLEVLESLTIYGIYTPDFNKCGMLEGDKSFERPYRWLMEQYNTIKKNEFSSAAVWWQTDIKEVLRCFKHQQKQGTNQILLMADVDDKDILLLDDDLWCTGPFMNCSLGFRGLCLYMSNNWTTKDEELFDKLYDRYDANQKSKEETWKQVFNITKSTEMIHAITPFIIREWITPKKYTEELF
jgi:hypothetical protein